jgi:hypothetical protein
MNVHDVVFWVILGAQIFAIMINTGWKAVITHLLYKYMDIDSKTRTIILIETRKWWNIFQIIICISAILFILLNRIIEYWG